MEPRLPCLVLTLVFITSPVLALLSKPKLHFEDKIIEDEETVIACSYNHTDCLEVNLEIEANGTTLGNCQQTKVNQPNQVYITKKTCRVEVTKSMHEIPIICEAHFKIQSKPEKLYLQTEPEFTNCSNKVDWIEGKENSFYCKATGYPPPTVTCGKGNAKYSEGVKYKTSRNMTGTYICRAINFDMTSREVQVSVQYKPEVLSLTVNPPLHNEGDSVTMTCEADGEPVPQYSWKTASSDVKFASDNKTITIRSLKRSHLGKYQCIASNKHGDHSLEEQLALAVQPKISKLTVEPSTNVLQGGNLTLSCQASGFPAPTIRWEYPKAGVEISPNQSTLKIWNAKMEHVGNYSCMAENKHGNATQRTQITLGAKPKVLNINVNPSTPVLENENLTLTCVAQGVPPPTYSWQLPSPNVLLSHDNVTINIFAAQKSHAGNYSCTAQNRHGRGTMTKTISVTGKSNRGGRMESSIITIFTVLIITSLTFYLS